MFLFQKQNRPGQILESLLIALSFTSPLEPRHIKSTVEGFVHNTRFYISNQKSRGYLKKKGDSLILTTKAKRLVQSSLIELILNRTRGDRKIRHETLLIRSLFLLLLHLNLTQIKQIKKQKRDSPYIPDLTIVTENDNIFIEIDTGTEPIKTIEAKIRGYEATTKGTLIYFTNSQKTYSYFSQSSVQFIYLQSQALSQDMQKLTSNNLKDSPLNVGRKEGVLFNQKTDFEKLPNQAAIDLEKRRAEALKLLYSDY